MLKKSIYILSLLSYRQEQKKVVSALTRKLLKYIHIYVQYISIPVSKSMAGVCG